MLETAYEYVATARVAYENHLYNPSLVNAGLALEILLKSFLSETGRIVGGIEETYKFDKRAACIKGHGHNLLELLDKIEPEVSIKLGFDKFRDDIKDYYKEPFLKARYPYEDDAPGIYSDHIIDMVQAMLDRTIEEYFHLGCLDPWVISIKSNHQLKPTEFR